MKKQFLIPIFAIVTFFAIFIGCQQEEFFLPRGKSEFRNPENLLPEVKSAIQWYRENNYQISEPRTRGGRHPLFDEMEPNWQNAAPMTGENYTLVETSLKTLTATRFINPECQEVFGTTEDNSIRKTLTRLVIYTDHLNKETWGFFMTIIPAPSYIQQREHWPIYNRYGRIDEQFTGTVIFHDLNGTRANGWIYENGEIIRIIPRSDETTAVATRGYTTVTNCVDLYEETCTTWHVVTEVEGEVINEYTLPTNCQTIYVGQDCWTSTEYVPDSPPSGGSGSSGGGSSVGTYRPPVCAKCNHSPCVCIKEETQCEGESAELLESVYAKFKEVGVEEKFIQLYKDASVEWYSALYDSCGSIRMLKPKTDHKPDRVKPVFPPPGATFLGTIHNHPSKNGPSVADAIALAGQNVGKDCKISYICTSDNRIFALVVTKPNAAQYFYEHYKDSVAMLELTAMCKDNWKEIRSYDKKSWNAQTSSLYALSTLLNTFNSGIEVMADTIIDNKRTFKLYRGRRIYSIGERIIKRTKCK